MNPFVPAVVVALASAGACAAQPPRLDLTPAQWREDLAMLVRELPARHMNAFHATTRAKFEAAAAALDQRLPALDGDQAYVGLETLVRTIGDGHTGLHTPDDAGAMPLRLRKFGDEWRVIQVAAGAEAALRARVVAIGGVPIAEAHARMLAVTPSDEGQDLRDALADMRLSTGLFLHGLDLAPDRNHARLDLEDDDGRTFSFEETALAPGAKPNWRDASPGALIAQEHPDDPLSCQPLAAGTALYCDFRSYHGLGGPAAKLRDELNSHPPDRLIIDLRQNGGGDYFVGLHELIEPIARLPAIDRKGHLFVLTGVMTFSAAMSNAAQFRQKTAAILVGEAIGERPNSYQENRELTLPNSHIVVSYSTRFYTFAPGDPENRIRPDVPVATSWADYKAGRDPVIDAALAYPNPTVAAK